MKAAVFLLVVHGFASVFAASLCYNNAGGAVVAALKSKSNSLAQADLPNCVDLSDAISLLWGIKGDVITFGVQAQVPPSTVYLGIGISELGSMKGADIMLLNSTAAKGWQLIDAHTPDFVKPIADKLQDLKPVGVMQQANGMLLAAWQRRMTPCDEDDLPITDIPMHVIWAFSSKYGYHGSTNRGSKLVSFFNNSAASSSASKVVQAQGGRPSAAAAAAQGLKVLDLTYPVDIPAKETTYMIKYFKLPNDKKYHVVSYEPITNSPLVHHGVLYSCAAKEAAAVQKLPAARLGPYDRLADGSQMLCEQFYMLHTPNMTAYHAPPDAGLVMGGRDSTWVALELHYNNPQGLTGLKDKGSGIRIYYTDKLRQHDVGLLTLQQPVLNIPPGVKSLAANVSVCPASCTKRFNTSSVKLLDTFLHMHGLGKSIIVRHIRGNRELKPIARLRAFDYAFQGNTPISAAALLPGDSLTLQCTFDSTSRSNVTRMGLGTNDEMCFAWLSYYPAQQDMGLCFSFGNQAFAVCGANMPGDLFRAFTAPDRAVKIKQLMQRGVLLPAEDPAASSTPYQEVCSPTTAF